ncbi:MULTISPECIES: hypothetical protein [Mycobacteroides]|jgi:hypothetical protein|uniref:Integral membrane protein n=1 Tax=Mycobacteroides chelonae TaxID=1774 RepID=A0A1S1LPZ1_MYCCH|nr:MULTISPECIES: hypothetical protein [Mycobacteroides]KRQ26723.1 hypothetical protein AOT87_01535 [Mycobacteroides sp. H003]KRQ28579.1 hypothetical protein AOT91_17185 [Mycobacteroides sp. H092]KRQ43989.1 hypothetical protein AOT92_06490 [Mycobacteroides sp. H101]KRQ50860.1 hypothetical protein AOT88_05430 [Mycobacteroides sp. H063]KRQ57324.1 hypothetical protein AOT94_15075 [Mycobacteroides sp. HXVII]
MSRTAIIIIVGVIAALAFLAVGALANKVGIQAAFTHFLVAWAGVAVFNMGVGVFEAGYGVAEELPVLLAVFGVPAAVAGIGWLGARRLSRS